MPGRLRTGGRGRESTVRCLLFVLLWSLCLMAEGTEKGCAVLIGTNVVALGTFPATEERAVCVKIKNAGEGDLKIEGVVLTCDCLRLDRWPKRVPSGKTGDVRVVVKKNELAGAFRRVFHVRTDDPKARLITIAVEGTATPPGFRVVPDQVILQPSEGEAVRRFLIVFDRAQVLETEKLMCRSSLNEVRFFPSLSKGGNGFLIKIIFPADVVSHFTGAREEALSFRYNGGQKLTIPIRHE